MTRAPSHTHTRNNQLMNQFMRMFIASLMYKQIITSSVTSILSIQIGDLQQLAAMTGVFTRVDIAEINRNILHTLQTAAKVLPYHDFQHIFEKVMRAMLSKAELEDTISRREYLNALKKLNMQFKGGLQLHVRILLLEISLQLSSHEVATKFNTIKHIILGTQLEYLLPKVFILESRQGHMEKDEQKSLRALKKSISLNQECAIEYMKSPKEIQKEIIDNTVISFHEMFKLKQKSDPVLAQEMLSRAIHFARKNYNAESCVVKDLEALLRQFQIFAGSLQKNTLRGKAITQIVDIQLNKEHRMNAFYCWQDERIAVQLVKIKNLVPEVLAQTSYEIVLDLGKIQTLKNGKWIRVEEGEPLVDEEELLKSLREKSRVSLKNISRNEIIKKDCLSSSSEDSAFFDDDEFKLIAKLALSSSASKALERNS